MLPLATALSDSPGLFDAITYQVIGLLVVFTALGSIWLMMELMGLIFRSVEQRAAQKAELARPPVPVAAAPAVDEAIGADLIAVITAAAYSAMQAGDHIVAIHPVGHGHENIQLLAWSSEGRRHIFASHKVR